MTAFWLRFALRSLVRRRSRSAVTLGAIALGVAVLIFLGGIMVGVSDTMIENSVSLQTGHLLVRSDDAEALITRWRDRRDLPDEVEAALPRLIAPAMIAAETGAAAVQIVGVMPAREKEHTAIPSSGAKGRYLSDASNVAEIFLGVDAAGELGATVGDSVQVSFADGAKGEATLVGLFDTGIEHIDRSVAHVPLDWLMRFESAKRRGEVALFLRRGVESGEAAARIEPLLDDGETVTTWQVLLPELEQLTRLNVVSMAIVIILVVILMAAGLSNTVLVSVMDRYREFGVLKALGTTPGEITGLILMETAVMCLVAGALGLVAGCAVTLVFGHTGLDLSRFTSENPHFVMSGVVYPRLEFVMTAAPVIAVLGVSVLASLWPAWIAARRRAAEVMRMSA